jgi:alkylhydroperoxidase family enzyme
MLDGDWKDATPKDRAAYAFARKITAQPHKFSDADFADLKAHYSDKQILEMTLSVAGNNSINRWKEGAGIPQNRESSNFSRNAEKPLPTDRVLPIKTYLTPTSEKYQKLITQLTPLEVDPATGKTGKYPVCIRESLESRDVVEKKLAECRTRTPRLPLADAAKVAELLGEDAKGPVTQYMRLMATHPTQSKSRLTSQITAEEKGNLSPLLKAQVSWIIARQDRALYATAEAKRRLKALGQSDDQIYALDGDWASFTPTERAMFQIARQLAASPIVLTDADVDPAVKLVGNRDVVQLINYVTTRAAFHRITEVAGLQAED